MSWVNLDDVYVNKTGDTIAGDLSVGGALTINDGKGTDTTYNVANEITTLRDSVSQKVLWDGSKSRDNFELSDSLSNWILIGVYVSIDSANNSRKSLIVPCSIPIIEPSGYGLNGMSSAMSSTDIRDFRVSLKCVDDMTLSYKDVVKTTLYPDSSSVQSTVHGRNVNGIVGLVRR